MKQRNILIIAGGCIGSTEMAMSMAKAVLELEKQGVEVVCNQQQDFPTIKETLKPSDLGLVLNRFEDMPRISHNFETKSKYFDKPRKNFRK